MLGFPHPRGLGTSQQGPSPDEASVGARLTSPTLPSFLRHKGQSGDQGTPFPLPSVTLLPRLQERKRSSYEKNRGGGGPRGKLGRKGHVVKTVEVCGMFTIL